MYGNLYDSILQMKNVLVGCTGSVATIKIPELWQKLKEFPDITVKLGNLLRQIIEWKRVHSPIVRSQLIEEKMHMYIVTTNIYCKIF